MSRPKKTETNAIHEKPDFREMAQIIHAERVAKSKAQAEEMARKEKERLEEIRKRKEAAEEAKRKAEEAAIKAKEEAERRKEEQRKAAEKAEAERKQKRGAEMAEAFGILKSVEIEYKALQDLIQRINVPCSGLYEEEIKKFDEALHSMLEDVEAEILKCAE